MSLQAILGALAGGAEGAAKGLMFNSEQDLDRQRLAQQAEIARQQQEIRLLLETLKEQGRADRHAEASGSVIAQQEGATARAGLADTTRRRGQDLTFQLGMTRNDTALRGQDVAAGTAAARNRTDNRRIDVARELGMDRARIAREVEAGRTTRAEATQQLKEKEIAMRERIERMRREAAASGRDFLGESDEAMRFIPHGTDIDLPDEGTGRPTAQPVELEPQARDPLPVSPGAPAEAAAQLETQARGLLQKVASEQDPARKKALLLDLARLREAILKARQGGQ